MCLAGAVRVDFCILESCTRAYWQYPITAPPPILPAMDLLLSQQPDPSLEVAEIWEASLGSNIMAPEFLKHAPLKRSKVLQEQPHANVMVRFSSTYLRHWKISSACPLEQ